MKHKLLTNKKRTAAFILILLLIIAHCLHSASLCFYEAKYPRQDITQILEKESLSNEDYMLIFNQTGVSPGAARELIQKGDGKLLLDINKLYFKKPEIKKEYIAFPVTASETNASYAVPFADIKKGDILVTFNTHTLYWRHGHCALVIDDENGLLLEHMSIGNPSRITNIKSWEQFPGFLVLRHPDEDIAKRAVQYAKSHLVGIDYNVFAGLIKKDKTGEDNPSSQCAHIVWQAYKAAGADIDSSADAFVIPKDIALLDKLKLVQIYGINPQKYKQRILK